MPKPNLIKIGYWFSEREQELIFPVVSLDFPARKREIVANYLRDAPVVESYHGSSKCRICDIENGSDEHSDGTYLWPSGLAHYVEAHSISLPKEFLAHVLNPKPVPNAYTVGHTKSYEAAFKVPGPHLKVGRCLQEDGTLYEGGIVFRTQEDAELYLKQHPELPWSVYGLIIHNSFAQAVREALPGEEFQ